MSRIDNTMSRSAEINSVSRAQQTLALDELSPQSLYEKCTTLAQNLWWSWHPEVTNL